jgi:saccharopine dehydrogenase-like NADP-dependent oxidoreductase
MSAMRIIDYIHDKGGNVDEFYSLCGALPSLEDADNPFMYKFSWSPKGVIMASNNDGRYLKHGKETYVSSENLLDSIDYIDIYKIPEAKTMFRGTFRHKGWCETLDVMKRMNLITYDKLDLKGKTYGEMTAILIGEKTADNLKQKAAGFLGIDVNAHALKAIEWLGLFDDKPVDREEDSPFEVVSDLMLDKMSLGKEERDMVVMMHTFLASYPDGKKEVIKSRLLDFGSPSTDTSVARTVALPAAIAAKMILNGKINIKGVYRPVLPEIYEPVLNELEKIGIKMVEDYDLPESEMIN